MKLAYAYLLVFENAPPSNLLGLVLSGLRLGASAPGKWDILSQLA